jgi:predicted transcriptional regulator
MAKQTNDQKILKALENGPMTQAELAKATKIRTVYQKVAYMVKKGTVVKDGKMVKLPIAIDTADKVDGKQMSEMVHKATKRADSTLLEYFKSESQRVIDEIETRLVWHSYIMSQLDKLRSEG